MYWKLCLSLGVVLVLVVSAQAAVVGATQAGTVDFYGNPLSPLGDVQIIDNFANDFLVASDRTHTVNAAAQGEVGAGPWKLVLGGTPNRPFPSYLEGGQQVRMYQSTNREIADYTLTITTDMPSYVYVLIDNRAQGNPDPPPPDSEYDDPTIQGALSWLSSFERMNTGVCINDAPDYVGIDENNDGELNQNCAIYRSQTVGNTITLGALCQTVTMYTAIVQPIPEPMTMVMLGLGSLALIRRK